MKIFEVLLSSKESKEDGKNDRLLAAVLTGINKARPILNGIPLLNERKDKEGANESWFEKYCELLFKITNRTTNIGTCLQCCFLLHSFLFEKAKESKEKTEKKSLAPQVGDSPEKNLQDRFYRMFYMNCNRRDLLNPPNSRFF